jgi:hypothetical protein
VKGNNKHAQEETKRQRQDAKNHTEKAKKSAETSGDFQNGRSIKHYKTW